MLSEICSGGLQIQTDKFRYIPQPALVEGVDFFDTPNHHMIHLYPSEIDYSIKSFNETDGNMFYMHWDGNLIQHFIDDNDVGTILFAPKSGLKNDMVGKAICKWFNKDWIDYMAKNYLSSVGIKYFKQSTITLRCDYIDKFMFIKQLNYAFRKIAENN